MALHADAQAAALAVGVLADARLRELELRQHAVGHLQQVFAGLRQPQAAALAQPDVGAQLLLELLDRMAQRGLRQEQRLGRGGQRTELVDLLDDRQVDAFKHVLDP